MSTHMHARLGEGSILFARWRRLDLWRGIAWGIAGICLYDGSGYAYAGNRLAQGGGFAALRAVPFGLHGHGFIMLLFAALLIYSSANGGAFAKRVCIALFAYSVGFVVALIWGMSISGQVTWSAPSKWFLISWLSILLASTAEGYQARQIEQERTSDAP